ncbi:NAD(P)-binding protein [Pseudorhodoferax sp.]|uniref:NAD(P)-binding protein n=1 Tax=Pseudorhodoferax sp. TaxID=1993553 RepID=UPI002DD6B8EB|nr:NAD(P)-binding protein [Pseudorhodoferax sp.]
MGTHETDYLVIGAGAMGMAFADALFDLCDARITLVDRHHQPGGHWNDAYSFVRLHQPSAFYGLNSEPLASPVVEASGPHAGLYEMATGSRCWRISSRCCAAGCCPRAGCASCPWPSMSAPTGRGASACARCSTAARRW